MSRGWIRFGCVYGLSVLIRGLHAWFLSDRASSLLEFPNLDEAFYSDWVEEIRRDGWLGTGPFHGMPLLPYGVALFQLVFGRGLLALSVAQVLVFSLIPVLISALAGRLAGARAGWMAGIAAGVYGPLVVYTSTFLPASLSALLNLAVVLSLLWSLESEARLRTIFLSGTLFGLSVLARAQTLVFFPVAGLFLLCLKKRDRWRAGMVYGAGVVFALAPTLIRNVIVTGDLTLVSSNGGINFHIGNGRGANGIWRAPPGIRRTRVEMMEDARRVAEESEGRSLSPEEVSSYWMGRAIEEMLERKGETLGLLVRKVRLVASNFEVPNVVDLTVMRGYSPILAFLPLSFGVLFLLAVIGVFPLEGPFEGERRRCLWVTLGFLLCGLGILVAFFVNARLRIPLVPFVLALAARGGEGLILAVRDRGWRRLLLRLGIAGSLLWGVFAVPFTDVEVRRLRANSGLLAGWSFFRAGDFPECQKQFREAVSLDPRSGEAKFRLAHSYGRELERRSAVPPDAPFVPSATSDEELLSRALLAYRDLLGDHPDHFEGNLNAGILVIQEVLPESPNHEARLRSAEEAERWLARAVALKPEHPSAHTAYGIVLAVRGDREGARDQFLAALSLEPNQKLARKQLELLNGR